jgi:sigma-B regulation protein RsbU (phosphoserine phosphatase)
VTTIDPAAISVLVVDDSAFNRLLLTRRLAELGYTAVSYAEDGERGLAAILAGSFDVVLLDIEMPGLDGIGVLERLRGLDRAVPPVIVISALTEMTAIVRCIELGAEDFLPKSFDPTLLRARLSAVLEKKRLADLAAQRLAALEAELESARAAQVSLVPHDFAAIIAGGRLDLYAAMIPARQVGGDLYDAVRLDANTLLFGVGDVSGKGAPAALTMARSLGLVRASARLCAEQRCPPDPGELLSLANEDLARENDDMTFVTVALGVLDIRTGEGLLAVAGHDPPILLRDDAAPRDFAPVTRQPPLGAREGVAYRSDRFTLGLGEALLLFSDGVTEAEDPAGRPLDRAGLLAALQGLGADPRRVVDGVLAATSAFAATAPQADDITALALRLR